MTNPRQTLVLFMASLLLTGICRLSAGAEAPVLVLNSDEKVWKYQETENAFSEEWGGPLVRMNLGDDSVGDADIKRHIADISPSAVYCIGSKAYLLAGEAMAGEPLVLSSAIHWQRLPEYRNALVIANELPASVQLTHFRRFFPGVKRIGVLGSRKISRKWIRDAVSDSAEAGVEVVYGFVDRPWQTKRQLQKLLPRVDALWVIPDHVVLSSAADIRELFSMAHDAKKPVFAYSQNFTDLGATLVVSPDDPTIGRQAASLLRACRAPVPPPSKVQPPAGTEISINLRLVGEYELELNEQALDSVNHIIR